jgi:hypothetical protein
MPHTLYRIVQGPSPTAADFQSHMAECEPRRAAELIDHALWAGVSTFDDPRPAAQRARRFSIGTHLARLEVPDDYPTVVVRQTLEQRSGHFTVWACDELLLSFVREFTAVPPRSGVQ